MDGKKVCIKLFTIINKIESRFPGIKVIVSEITPRMDNRDSEVKICNNMMNGFAKHRNNIFVVGHSNLRGSQFFHDTKHIKETKIPKFAANIKRTLHKALDTLPQGSPRYNRSSTGAGYNNINGMWNNNKNSNGNISSHSTGNNSKDDNNNNNDQSNNDNNNITNSNSNSNNNSNVAVAALPQQQTTRNSTSTISHSGGGREISHHHDHQFPPARGPGGLQHHIHNNNINNNNN